MKSVSDGKGGLEVEDFQEQLFISLMEGNWAGRNAFKVGTRIRKIRSGLGDRAQDGWLGTVLGSAGPANITISDYPMVEYFYLVKWDNDEARGCAICDFKIEEIK